jgi:hypothetical protein
MVDLISMSALAQMVKVGLVMGEEKRRGTKEIENWEEGLNGWMKARKVETGFYDVSTELEVEFEERQRRGGVYERRQQRSTGVWFNAMDSAYIAYNG